MTRSLEVASYHAEPSLLQPTVMYDRFPHLHSTSSHCDLLLSKFPLRIVLRGAALHNTAILTSYLHSLLSLKRNYSTYSSSLFTLYHLSNNYRTKITNRSFHLTASSCLVEYRLPPDLRRLSPHYISSEPNLDSPAFSPSPSVFLKKNSKLISFTFSSSSSLIAYRLPLDSYLRN
jgi:hypothetical protein